MTTTDTEPQTNADRTRARIMAIVQELTQRADGKITSSEAERLASEAVPPTTDEQQTHSSNRPNRTTWQHNLTDMVTKKTSGLLDRAETGTWKLTDSGRQAFVAANGSTADFFRAAIAPTPRATDGLTSSASVVPRLAKNLIMYGPPGTGKTFTTTNLALERLLPPDEIPTDRGELRAIYRDKVESGHIEFVTFHQAYSYEDFIEGIQAEVVGGDRADSGTGAVRYVVRPGIFRKIAKRAKQTPDENYVLIIDEINRGNISGIFGELITLIEEDKRSDEDEALTVRLPYSRKSFSVPSNLYIIGTMNTADRSLAGLDLALRRRFEFKDMSPERSHLESVTVEGVSVAGLMTVLNERIQSLKGRDFAIGHAFFWPLKEDSSIDMLQTVFCTRVIPLLQEYFFEDWSQIAEVLNQVNAPQEVRYLKKRKSSLPNGADTWSQDDNVLGNPEFYRRVVAPRSARDSDD